MSGVSRLVLAAGLLLAASPLHADDKPAAKEQAPAKPAAPRLDPFGDTAPEPFVPEKPRTAEQRDQVEVLRDFAVARALEQLKRPQAAIDLLKEALKKEPGSVAILRRLSLLHRARGKMDRAADLSRKALEADPGDTESLDFLFKLHIQKGDGAGAEALLKSVLDNPKLEKGSPAYMLAAYELGILYDGPLQQPGKAADALAKLVEALDQKSASNLSPLDQRRLQLDEPARAYARYGEVFFKARRYDLAARAFRRGLAYEPDNGLLSQVLAQTLVRSGRAAEALEVVEPFLKTRPGGREPYDVLAEVLTALKREKEVLPRLEAAAQADPENLPLRYALADRYRDDGQKDKADAIYKDLLTNQPDPQGFGALAASLRKEKRTDELIDLFGKAFTRKMLDSVKPEIESVANDPSYAKDVLDAGLKLGEAEPPKLSPESRRILLYIAAKAKDQDRGIALRRQGLKLKPDPAEYQELLQDLYVAGRYADYASVTLELMEKFPDEKTAETYLRLCQGQMLAGQFDEAIASANEALKRNPGDPDALNMIGLTLGRMGKNDEAIAHYRKMLADFPKNPEVAKQAHSGLSVIYVNMDQLDKGQAELEVIYKDFPDDAGINNDLGYLYADQGKNLEQAEAMIRKAVAERPDSSAYLDSLGWVLFKRGRLDEARAQLEKAVEQPNTDATIFDHMGDIYFQLKELAKARSAWEKAEKTAATAHPPDKRLADIKKKLEALGKLGIDPAAPPSPNP